MCIRDRFMAVLIQRKGQKLGEIKLKKVEQEILLEAVKAHTELFLNKKKVNINLSNVDPLDRFGPLPFELEIGTRWYVPVITKYSFGYTSTWIRISSYFQAW